MGCPLRMFIIMRILLKILYYYGWNFIKLKKLFVIFHLNNYDLNKLQYFIDLPIIGHIIGVLWILRCKYLLDDKLYKKCYGNLKKILKIDKI